MPFLRLGVRVLDVEGHGHKCKLGVGSGGLPLGQPLNFLGAGCKEDPRVPRIGWLRGYQGELEY